MNKEVDLNRQVKKYLSILKNCQPLWFYEPKDIQAGLPDFVGCYYGKFFAIELKTPNGKVSGIQHNTLLQIEIAEGQTTIATVLNAVKEFMQNIYEKHTER